MEFTKWEYKKVDFTKGVNYKEGFLGYGHADIVDNWEEIEKLGKKGWEVVGILNEYETGKSTGVLMKRPCGRFKVVEKVNGKVINEEENRSTTYDFDGR